MRVANFEMAFGFSRWFSTMVSRISSDGTQNNYYLKAVGKCNLANVYS
jgi:hypothetical protein